MNIQSDIPMPSQPDHRRKYPFMDMSIGDSVFFEGEPSKGKVSNAARKVATRNDMHFVVRTETGGIRIWRTK